MLGTASQLIASCTSTPNLRLILFTKMAYTMRTLAPSTSYISARPAVLSARSSRCVGGRARLVIEAKTVWQLAGQGGKEEINLTDAINTQKSFTSVGDKKHQDAEQVGVASHLHKRIWVGAAACGNQQPVLLKCI